MSTNIRFLEHGEAFVPADHPTADDTLNRALRDVLTASGVDPDVPFDGFATTAAATANASAIASEASNRASADTSEATARASGDASSVSTAASDASTKANAAQAAAIAAAASDATGKADAAQSAAISAAATDASAKANAAQAAAIASAATDATGKASTAEQNAKDYGDAHHPSYPVVIGEVGVVDVTMPWFTLERYGAALDGVTDDTIAILNAIASSYARGGKRIWHVAAGDVDCVISDTIEIPETVIWDTGCKPAYQPDRGHGLRLLPSVAFPAHADDKGVSRQIVIRSCGSTATPAPTYAHATASSGSAVRGLTIDMTNLGANAVAVSYQGVWQSALEDIKVIGMTLDSQIGFHLRLASDATGGSYWNRFTGLMHAGNPAAPHGVGIRIEGVSAKAPTQALSVNCRMQYGYRGLEMDYCGAGFVFIACAFENNTDDGVHITNQRTTGAPLFFGTESSNNGGWAYAGVCVCHETTAQGNTAGAYDPSVLRTRYDTANGWWSVTFPVQAPYFTTGFAARSVAASATITPDVGLISLTSTGGNVTLGATQISDGKQGQRLILRGGSNTDYVSIANGGNIRLKSDSYDLRLDSVIELVWSPTAGDWVEVSRNPGNGSETSASYAAGGTITASSELMTVSSSAGAAILLDGTTQIADGSPDQVLRLRGGSNTNYLRLINGGNIRLRTPAFDLKLDRVLTLVWSRTASDWVEMSRTHPNGNTISAAAGDSITPGSEFSSISSGSAGAILLDGTTQIADGVDGQLLILRGSSNTNYVTIINGANVRLRSDKLDLTLDAVLTLRFSTVAGDWVEQSRSVPLTVATKTANYTALSQDNGGRLRFDVTAASKVLTVTNALPIGWTVSVGKIDSSGNSVTVSGTSCTFNGASSLTTTTQYKSWTIMHIGSGVYDVIGGT